MMLRYAANAPSIQYVIYATSDVADEVYAARSVLTGSLIGLCLAALPFVVSTECAVPTHRVL